MIKYWLKQKISEHYPVSDFDVLTPPDDKMGDYSTNLAFTLARANHRNAEEVGTELVGKFRQDKGLGDIFDRIESAQPGFINFYLKEDFLRKQLGEISKDKNYGFNESMKGKTVAVEYTDPNPFKLFHIGHLMSNAIGEAIARLYEASGAKVIRMNWQGDAGLHIAMAVWGMQQGHDYLGPAYAFGAKAYNENPESKKEIDEINKKIYDQSDPKINELYRKGRQGSLDYFEKIYAQLGTKFDHYFFESEMGPNGLKIVKENSQVFEQSEGAIIFKGEKYGLHTRVFINSQGLPTYESKELGLNAEKFKLYRPDLSIIVTGNEINEYFKVLLKVMELIMPDVASKTTHIGHGMMRLPTGKMSSRTGEIISAESLVEQVESKLPESTPAEGVSKIAIGAIKYSILRQNPGQDIVFDFEKSLSIKVYSGPYLQYTYARLTSILTKSGPTNYQLSIINYQLLDHETELKLMKRLLIFPDVVIESGEETAPHHLALYLYELSNDANRFYESIRILDDENIERRNARLMLVGTVATVLEKGLNILGIEAPEKI